MVKCSAEWEKHQQAETGEGLGGVLFRVFSSWKGFRHFCSSFWFKLVICWMFVTLNYSKQVFQLAFLFLLIPVLWWQPSSFVPLRFKWSQHLQCLCNCTAESQIVFALQKCLSFILLSLINKEWGRGELSVGQQSKSSNLLSLRINRPIL